MNGMCLCIKICKHQDAKWNLEIRQKQSFSGMFVWCSLPNTYSTRRYLSYNSILGGACSTHEFLCGNQQCVPLTWTCDGEDDCGDNSDETASCLGMFR